MYVYRNDETKHFARLFWQTETRKCGSADDGTDQSTTRAIPHTLYNDHRTLLLYIYILYKQHSRTRRGSDCIIMESSDGNVVQLTVAAAAKFV